MRRIGRYVPVTVIVFAAISWYLAASGIRFTDVFAVGGATTLVNPAVYTVNEFFHAGGWSHFVSNLTLWLPFGVVLTWLTGNRHVLWLAVAVNFLTVAIAITIEGVGLGMSHVVFGVVAATLVRSTDYALQNASTEALGTVLAGLLVPALAGFLLIVVLADPRFVADFYHFLGFLFGGAIESIYVLGDRETRLETRSVPKDVGR